MNTGPIPSVTEPRHRELLAATRDGVAVRLEDPYLTDHDRWVLRQFASFLGGSTPEPDPRVIRISVARPLYARVRRASS